MEDGNKLFEKVVLGEIDGKNRAIHAYDGIVWKIRSGFLTLLFAGWAILLKGMVEKSATIPDYRIKWGLVIISTGLAFGAWYIDHSYTRRKFRVILALNNLIGDIHNCDGDFRKVRPELLLVAGDSSEMPFKTDGYNEALNVERVVYTVPLVTVIVVACWL